MSLDGPGQSSAPLIEFFDMSTHPRPPVPLEPSPAVERAAVAARENAAFHSRPVGYADWLAALLADEDGQPAQLLARLGGDPARLGAAAGQSRESTAVPSDRALYAVAQALAIRLRGDANLTTDVVLLAVLDSDPAVRRLATEHGADAEAVRRALLSPDIELSTPTEPAAVAVAAPTPEVGEPTRPATVDSHVADAQPVAARVVDANLNRAREALRVIEDYCRFGLNDRTLTETTKSVRHRLADAVKRLPPAVLLASRDTDNDVGTTIGTVAEYDRKSTAQVVPANCKRLQEALRSVEEYGKIFDAHFSQAVEQLRYESYTLEKLLARGQDARARLADARLYLLVSGDSCSLGLERTIGEAAAGGVNVVQLREKSLPDRELYARAELVRRWTREAGVLFIVNDRADLAVAAGADGVHLGQDDLPIAAVRRVVGPDRLVGVSTHNLDQVREAVRGGADYLGVGPTFPSRTKAFDQFPGLSFVRDAAVATTLPTFVLGGVGPDNIAEVIAAGGRRVAVAGAVAGSDDPRLSVTVLSEHLLRAKKFDAVPIP